MFDLILFLTKFRAFGTDISRQNTRYKADIRTLKSRMPRKSGKNGKGDNPILSFVRASASGA